MVHVFDLALGGLRVAFGCGALVFDAFLLGLHDLFGDPALVVELHELLLLAGQFVQSAPVALGFGASDRGVALDMGDERLTDNRLLVGG